MELSAVFVYLRTVVVAANLLSDVIASVKSRCFNIHTYIHTEPFIWRTTSTVHVESGTLINGSERIIQRSRALERLFCCTNRLWRCWAFNPNSAHIIVLLICTAYKNCTHSITEVRMALCIKSALQCSAVVAPAPSAYVSTRFYRLCGHDKLLTPEIYC